MSKKYLTIGEHGLNGDFYSCEDGPAFRADNLAIATKISFNNWLHDFTPLYRECTLVSITDGSFTVSVTDDGEPSRIETHTVAYRGPAEMFTAEFLHRSALAQGWYSNHYSHLEKIAAANDPRVRISNRSGLIIFNEYFPRWRRDGSYWSHENNYLCPDDMTLADEQMEFFGASEQGQEKIISQNVEAMKKLTQKQLEVCHD